MASHHFPELDIWIPHLRMAVEYHGDQHYRQVDFFGGETKFVGQQRRDQERREACVREGIKLIEVDYTWNGRLDGLLETYPELFN